MSKLRIDIDAEQVEFDGHWMTRDELARRIRGMLDAGEFAVSKPSAALEELTRTIASIRAVGFRATPDLADAIQQAATVRQVTPGAIIREALGQFLGLTSEADGVAPPRPSHGSSPVTVAPPPQVPPVLTATSPAPAP